VSPSDDPYRDPALYDLEYGDHDEDIAYYIQLARAARGPVLELGCGTGRLTVPMLKAGATVWGVDASQPMLDGLRAKLQGCDDAVRLRCRAVHGDFRTLKLIHRFPLVLWPFNAMHHCDDPDDVRATLDHIRALLLPGGQLALDCYLPDMALYDRDPEARYEQRTFTDPRTGGPLDSWEQGWWDADKHVHHVVYTYKHRDGTEEQAHLALRMFELPELRTLLSEQGWQITHEAQDFLGTPLSERPLKWVARARPIM
jgi:SAM-dependent methyltransferase